MRVAIIPARGGSKRIHRKNIKEFCGKPMIAWAIQLADTSELFDKVVVSTDDDEIAEVARFYGALVPFTRPAALSDDHATTLPVVAHAIRCLNTAEPLVAEACCIYPCSPLTSASDLREGLKLLRSSGAQFSFPVVEYPHPVGRAMVRHDGGALEFLHPNNEVVRTQDLPKYYHDAGQFYWGASASWLNEISMHSQGAGLVVPAWRAVDIDEIEDWERAELLFESIRRMGGIDEKN